MPSRMLALALFLACLAGCGTPSIHPIYADNQVIAEPALVGKWKTTDSAVTYTITSAGLAYSLFVESNDPNRPESWVLTARLVKIGDHRFADITAADKVRESTAEHWGPLLLPTHMFCRWTLEKDTLTIAMLNREWFHAATRNGGATLAHTSLDKDAILITAETPALQEFLRRWGGDDAAFADRTVLTRAGS